MQALTDLVGKLDNEVAKVKTQIENTSSTLADDAKRVGEAKSSVKDVSAAATIKSKGEVLTEFSSTSL